MEQQTITIKQQDFTEAIEQDGCPVEIALGRVLGGEWMAAPSFIAKVIRGKVFTEKLFSIDTPSNVAEFIANWDEHYRDCKKFVFEIYIPSAAELGGN